MKKAYILLCAGLFSVLVVYDGFAQNQQGQWDLTVPSISALLPLSNVVDDNAFGTGTRSGQHELSAMFGARITYWFAAHMGAELEVLFAPSALENTPFGISGTNDAQFFALDARLVHAFGGDGSRLHFLLTGGLGIWATSYADYDMTTGGMGVIAVGLRTRLDRSLSFRLDLSNYLTTINWENTVGVETDKIIQHDLALTAGFIMTLNKK